MSHLFNTITVGDLTLSNRIVMAPLTRGRAGLNSIPNKLMMEYYRQRAAAGLIISEATHISPQGKGWVGAPGIHNSEQVAAWQYVTDAVHQANGKIFLQLWHMGRASHPDFHNGELPVAPSAIAIQGSQIRTPQGKKDQVVPRALETSEISSIVHQYATATQLAQAAGFDGVEIHAANGYLIDQFLRDGSNKRTDQYGGSIENRARFLLEVTKAVVESWKPERVGLRLSPTSNFNDQYDSDPKTTFTYVAEQLNAFNLCYLHVLEALPGHMLAMPGERITPFIREVFNGPLMINGGYTKQLATEAVEKESADLVSFGVPFIANPDLVKRFKQDADLNQPDYATFYTDGEKGYTDYSTL
ncbi:MAG: alkene reductase [Pseudomonadota bacterium]